MQTHRVKNRNGNYFAKIFFEIFTKTLTFCFSIVSHSHIVEFLLHFSILFQVHRSLVDHPRSLTLNILTFNVLSRFRESVSKWNIAGQSGIVATTKWPNWVRPRMLTSTCQCKKYWCKARLSPDPLLAMKAKVHWVHKCTHPDYARHLGYKSKTSGTMTKLKLIR